MPPLEVIEILPFQDHYRTHHWKTAFSGSFSINITDRCPLHQKCHSKLYAPHSNVIGLQPFQDHYRSPIEKQPLQDQIPSRTT